MASQALHREVKRESVSAEQVERDKQFVAHYAESQHTLAPEEIAQDAKNKELGHSSKGLSVKDFDLVRTLGTGTCLVRNL